MSSNIGTDLAKCLAGVTKKFTKQRKAEERNSRAVWSREYIYSDRVNFTDVARRIFPAAYRQASGDGKYPASKRQVYYAAREEFAKATGREITQQRCDAILLQFMNRHPAITAGWRVTADPRGTLFIPNTFEETRIPCGTIDIDNHLAAMSDEEPLDEEAAKCPRQWPTLAPGERFRAVLYIEKEGFEPLLRQMRIAERYEIAVLSCKGQSVVAARKYVDHVCRMNGGVPLFVVHDFDYSGFIISARLHSVSYSARKQERVAYDFQNEIDVTDFGLRLVDAQKYGLASERCKGPKYIDPDLGCTDEEEKFLYSGRRIELNAFTAPQFVEWLEGKLQGAGLTDRLIPVDDVLERAYRRSVVTSRINEASRAMHGKAVEEAKAATLPKRMKARLRALMAERDEPWDIALYRLACEELGIVEPDDDDEEEGIEAAAALLRNLGISARTAKQARELAKYSEAEMNRAIEELRSEREELTTDAIAARIRRNRRKRKK